MLIYKPVEKTTFLKEIQWQKKNKKIDLQKNEASSAQMNRNYLSIISLFKSISILLVFFFHFSTSGLFAAAHDLKIEWLVVKGVCGFVHGAATSNDSWKTFASVMAASVVSNMLSNSFVFRDWPHYGLRGTCTFLSQLWLCLPRDLVTCLISSV